MSETSKAILEDHNPVHLAFKQVSNDLGIDYPLDQNDYAQVISGAIGCIPVVGALASSVFNVVWSKLFPAPEKYVTIENFQKKIKQLYVDMENKMNQKLDEHTRKYCDDKYEALLTGGFLFRNSIRVFISSKRNNRFTGDEKQRVQQFMTAHHATFENSLAQALTFFSNKNWSGITIKLYLQTVAIYISFLKDTIVFGEDWGLPHDYLYGGSNVESIETKLHDAIKKAFQTYKTFLKSFFRKKTSIPNWSILVSTYLHGDYMLYKHDVKWIKRHTPKDSPASFIFPSDINKPFIFAFDVVNVSKSGGKFAEVYEDRERFFDGQSTNFITNTIDNRYTDNKGKEFDLYFTIYENHKRNVSLRLFTSCDNGFQVTFYELDSNKVNQNEKIGYKPDNISSITINKTTASMKKVNSFLGAFDRFNTNIYESEPVPIKKSKVYLVQINSPQEIFYGAMFHRIDVIVGEPLNDSDTDNRNEQSYIELEDLELEGLELDEEFDRYLEEYTKDEEEFNEEFGNYDYNQEESNNQEDGEESNDNNQSNNEDEGDNTEESNDNQDNQDGNKNNEESNNDDNQDNQEGDDNNESNENDNQENGDNEEPNDNQDFDNEESNDNQDNQDGNGEANENDNQDNQDSNGDNNENDSQDGNGDENNEESTDNQDNQENNEENEDQDEDNEEINENDSQDEDNEESNGNDNQEGDENNEESNGNDSQDNQEDNEESNENDNQDVDDENNEESNNQESNNNQEGDENNEESNDNQEDNDENSGQNEDNNEPNENINQEDEDNSESNENDNQDEDNNESNENYNQEGDGDNNGESNGNENQEGEDENNEESNDDQEGEGGDNEESNDNDNQDEDNEESNENDNQEGDENNQESNDNDNQDNQEDNEESNENDNQDVGDENNEESNNQESNNDEESNNQENDDE